MRDATVYAKGTTVPDKAEFTFGPYGDKMEHGTLLLKDSATATPDGEQAFRYLHWEFTAWGCATDAETVAFVKKHPAVARDMLNAQFLKKARYTSWAENRGGATTVDVRINGVLYTRQALGFVKEMQSKGVKLEIVERVKTPRKVKASK